MFKIINGNNKKIMTIEFKLDKRIVKPVYRNGNMYYFEFDRATPSFAIYEYQANRLKQKGLCLYRGVIDTETIRNIAEFTDYGFRKHIFEIIDASFELYEKRGTHD